MGAGLRSSLPGLTRQFSAGSRRRADRVPGRRRPSKRVRCQLERDPPPLFGRPIAGVVDLRGLVGQAEIGTRLAPDRHAFHEILYLLQVAARPLLFEADELPARLAIDPSPVM